MPLADYSFVFNGLTIGNNTLFTVTKVDGLGGTSPLRIQDDNRGYIDGSYSGRDFYDERTVYIDVTVLGSSSITAQANYKTLQEAYAPQPVGYYPNPTGSTPVSNQLKEFQFRLNTNTGDKIMYGRSRGIVTPIDADFTYGYIQCRIMMSFPDPRYYDSTLKTSNGAVLTNDGWATSCPVITIASPLASGLITDGDITMYFANVPTGAQLVVDTLQRVVYTAGIPTRALMTASSNGWLYLEPDSINSWSSTIGTMSIAYRNAYV
jgi:hypothetical protein